MSPDRAAIAPRRVIRAGFVPPVTALSFPTIVEAPPALPVELVDDEATDVLRCEAPSPAFDVTLLDEARIEAAARGYDDGHRAGRDEAIAAVRHDVSGLLTRLQEAIDAFEGRRQQTFDDLTDDVARFAFTTVESILDRELTLAANPARDAIERALRLAPDRVTATVLVHPTDAELIGSLDDLAGSRAVELAVDATVERGSCVVHAGDCEVDAQLEGALDRLRTVLGIVGEEQP